MSEKGKFGIKGSAQKAKALNLASEIQILLDQNEKGVQRDAMRALASLLGGKFVLDSDMDSRAARIVSMARPATRLAKDGKPAAKPPQPIKAAWRSDADWIESETIGMTLLADLKGFSDKDMGEEAIAARSRYKDHLMSQKDLKSKLRAKSGQ
jgi:hypothetical protein